jgi:hypothetical protein
MKRVICGTAILFVVSVTCAHADSVSVFNINRATMTLGFGGGGSFALTGPGTKILGTGGFSCGLNDWCQGATFAPGSELPLLFAFDGRMVIFRFKTVEIGGRTFDPNMLVLPLAMTLSGTITFPTNQVPRFTTCIPAHMPGPIAGQVGQGDGFMSFNLNMPQSGSYCSDWILTPRGYVNTQATFVSAVPEPGTLGLMASGLAGIIGMIRRKRNCRSPM